MRAPHRLTRKWACARRFEHAPYEDRRGAKSRQSETHVSRPGSRASDKASNLGANGRSASRRMHPSARIARLRQLCTYRPTAREGAAVERRRKDRYKRPFIHSFIRAKVQKRTEGNRRAQKSTRRGEKGASVRRLCYSRPAGYRGTRFGASRRGGNESDRGRGKPVLHRSLATVGERSKH